MQQAKATPRGTLNNTWLLGLVSLMLTGCQHHTHTCKVPTHTLMKSPHTHTHLLRVHTHTHLLRVHTHTHTYEVHTYTYEESTHTHLWRVHTHNQWRCWPDAVSACQDQGACPWAGPQGWRRRTGRTQGRSESDLWEENLENWCHLMHGQAPSSKTHSCLADCTIISVDRNKDEPTKHGQSCCKWWAHRGDSLTTCRWRWQHQLKTTFIHLHLLCTFVIKESGHITDMK